MSKPSAIQVSYNDLINVIQELADEAGGLKVTDMAAIGGMTEAIRDIKAENAKFKEELEAVKAENDRHHEAFMGISNACIGALTMNYPLDAESIGQEIYMATGMTNPELNEYANKLEKGND